MCARQLRLALGQFDLIGVVELCGNSAGSAIGQPQPVPSDSEGEPQGRGEHHLPYLDTVVRTVATIRLASLGAAEPQRVKNA